MNPIAENGMNTLFGDQNNLMHAQTEEFVKALEVAIRKFAPKDVADKYVSQLDELVAKKMEIFANLAAVGEDINTCQDQVRKELEALQVKIETQTALEEVRIANMEAGHKAYIQEVLTGAAA